jgi:3-oxoacyl-[acyl-carrier protein] reductase
MSEPEKKWVLVTGGSRGIGRAIVERLVQSGFDVAFTYKSSAVESKELAARLSSGSRICRAIQCDGSDPENVRRAVNGLLAEHGAPFALVNNMGIMRDGSILSVEPEQLEAALRTNVESMFSFTRAASQAMISRGDGVILQMSSVSGIKGSAGQSVYSATKAAMLGFTRSLSLELARFNIRVNAIAPGYIETDMVAQMSPAAREKAQRQIPLKRLGKPEEVASLVDFLLSPSAAYMTGQTLLIDGGLSC